MEEARRLLGMRLVGEVRPRPSGACLRVALTSVLLVALLCHPAGLPRGPKGAGSPAFTASGALVEIVTPDEKRLLDALRSPGSVLASSEETVPAPLESVEERPSSVAEMTPQDRKRAGEADAGPSFVRAESLPPERISAPAVPREPRPVVPSKADVEPATEDLLRLLQVGQRALGAEGVTVVQ